MNGCSLVASASMSAKRLAVGADLRRARQVRFAPASFFSGSRQRGHSAAGGARRRSNRGGEAVVELRAAVGEVGVDAA